MTGATGPPPTELLEKLFADAEAVATDYRENGWTVVGVQPGDMTPVDRPERTGLSVLVPTSEYDRVEALVEDEQVAFEETEVFTRAANATTAALAVESDAATATAVVLPLWYSAADAEAVFEAALETGELSIHVRPLATDRWVTFTHDDPSVFLAADPATEGTAADGTDQTD